MEEFRARIYINLSENSEKDIRSFKRHSADRASHHTVSSALFSKIEILVGCS